MADISLYFNLFSFKHIVREKKKIKPFYYCCCYHNYNSNNGNDNEDNDIAARATTIMIIKYCFILITIVNRMIIKYNLYIM